ncbi:MAG: hypothetical protein NWE83_11825 [Candidatus Bathyarchaeota archaeon]|nr:hypothetical protein [Candidatus Bathyarchaeota archaeon]
MELFLESFQRTDPNARETGGAGTGARTLEGLRHRSRQDTPEIWVTPDLITFQKFCLIDQRKRARV